MCPNLSPISPKLILYIGTKVEDTMKLNIHWKAVNHRYAVDKKDAAAKALNAGLDMEMVSTCYLTYLKELVQEGKVCEISGSGKYSCGAACTKMQYGSIDDGSFFGSFSG